MILSTQDIEKEYARQICWQTYDNIRLCPAGSDINSSLRSFGTRHFCLTRYTIRSWQKRLVQLGPRGLNDESHRPRNLRQTAVSWEIVSKVVRIRKQYPAWSKYKIQGILKQENIIISASTIGRILKRKNMIKTKISIKRSQAAKNPRKRFPRGFKVSQAGDMVQIDTKHIMTIGGRKFYQFTAIDVLGKGRVLRVYSSATSRNGAHFLQECVNNFDFEIKNIQTDNGSEFLGKFDELCKKLNIPHYFIYPRHPKQNCYVESSHSADEREFYQQGNISPILEVMQKRIVDWQNVWNKIRPHESLNYLTPEAYYRKWQTGRLPTKDVISLQT
ncbi:DDE-type integrase/transposase/recombinase [Candidatus Wolfebacteria bacterium]|nr:DDE-type integrase/transposase/recombinase [Candidatus Wolfebacteria bacterium]